MVHQQLLMLHLRAVNHHHHNVSDHGQVKAAVGNRAEGFESWALRLGPVVIYQLFCHRSLPYAQPVTP